MRATSDRIALVLAYTVAIVVITTAIGVLYVRIFRPEQDVSEAVVQISRLVSVIIAALVGYMAGRKTDA